MHDAELPIANSQFPFGLKWQLAIEHWQLVIFFLHAVLPDWRDFV
jgi:hypothetical protein